MSPASQAAALCIQAATIRTLRACPRTLAQAHAAGLKLKMYYTIRELSDHADELWVLRSLGHEVLTKGKGGGAPRPSKPCGRSL